jgi:hypothetical protein
MFNVWCTMYSTVYGINHEQFAARDFFVRRLIITRRFALAARLPFILGLQSHRRANVAHIQPCGNFTRSHL